MAKLSDLFTKSEAKEVAFDISTPKNALERLSKAADELGGQPFARAKVGSGGITLFTVSCGNKEINLEQIEGIVIAQHAANAYFAKSDTDENTPPICSSSDGRTGIVAETGEIRKCANCPYNEYGTDNNGKLCKNMRRLYMLCEGVPLPVMLTLPPTSLEPWKSYVLMDIVASGLDISQTVTKFTLKKAKSKGGKDYAIVNAEIAGTINGKTKSFAEEYGKRLTPHNMPVLEAADYNRETTLEKESLETTILPDPAIWNSDKAEKDENIDKWYGEVVQEEDNDELNFDEL